MSIIVWVLDLLFLSWLFWPILFGVPILCWIFITSAVKDEEFTIGAALLMLLVLFANFWRYSYPSLAVLTTWHFWVTGLTVYLGAGFVISTYKWFMVIMNLRKDLQNKVLISTHKNDIQHHHPDWDGEEIARAVVRVIEDKSYYSKLKVEADGLQVLVFPNWKKYPIGTWWVYWPFFLLEVVFDPIQRVVEKVVDFLKDYYHYIAKYFAVKG
jgi:hypothetical protein